VWKKPAQRVGFCFVSCKDLAIYFPSKIITACSLEKAYFQIQRLTTGTMIRLASIAAAPLMGGQDG